MTKVRSAAPGDILWVNSIEYDIQGRETKKDRPWVVVSERDFSKATGRVFAAAITSGVGAPDNDLKVPFEGVKGIDDGLVLTYEVRSLDIWERGARKVGTMPAGVMGEVREILADILGLVLPGG